MHANVLSTRIGELIIMTLEMRIHSSKATRETGMNLSLSLSLFFFFPFSALRGERVWDWSGDLVVGR